MPCGAFALKLESSVWFSGEKSKRIATASGTKVMPNSSLDLKLSDAIEIVLVLYGYSRLRVIVLFSKLFRISPLLLGEK
jgi:hypothetical protein